MLAASCDVDQPDIGCPVQSLTWVATYHPVGTHSCGNKAGEQLGVSKYFSPQGESQFAIKPATLSALDGRDPQRPSYSQAAMPEEANAEGFCVVPSLPEMRKQAEADPTGAEPAVSVSYRWSNVRIVSQPVIPGTQFVADLEYTENGCTAAYEVWAMWPGDVSCDNGQGAPDETRCETAITLNSDFATKCDPTLSLCVPAKRPPSLK
ncbi:MlpA [Stigmatella aurantiaca DW4/3-1]|nr:MlpA [Stigmatella aurantiaca DW4/3-1]